MSHAPRQLAAATAVAVLVGLVLGGCGGGSGTADGREVFVASCARCHGDQGQGLTTGPPLTLPAYTPPQLTDTQVRDAIRHGVPAQRFDFGPMPGFPGLSEEQVTQVIAYVRELQADAGLLSGSS